MDTFQKLKDFMDTVPQLGLSGIDCIIYREHEEIFRYDAGYSDIENQVPMQPNALYNIYSATKIVTCIATLQLVEDGKILLTDPLYMYLPEFKEMYVKSGTFIITPATKHIRIADLLTMTAGLSYERDTPQLRKLFEEKGLDFNTREFVETLAKEPLLFEPGEGWNYSFCHDVLAAVIEVVTGKSFGAYLEEKIFKPLGMKTTGFSVAEEKKINIAPQYEYNPITEKLRRISSDCVGVIGLRHESGGGGLITTLEDYILFADALACGGIGKYGERIISVNSINLMRTNQLEGKSYLDYKKMIPAEGVGYGLGVSVVMDAAKAFRLVPDNSFSWGGLGGVHAFIYPTNKISYFVAQHCLRSPKHLIEPKMLNILYGAL